MYDYQFLYFIRNPITKRLKIGITNNPESRITALRKKHNLQSLFFEHVIGFSTRAEVESAEKHWHTFLSNRNRRFALKHRGKYKVSTEWFALSQADVKLIVGKIYWERASLFSAMFAKPLLQNAPPQENFEVVMPKG